MDFNLTYDNHIKITFKDEIKKVKQVPRRYYGISKKQRRIRQEVRKELSRIKIKVY